MVQTLTQRLVWIPLGLVLALGVGCSDGRNVAPVSGTVTLDGKPLADISVYFQPTATSGEKEVGIGSYGVTDEEGRYTLRLSDTDTEGALVGTHEVRLSDKRAEGEEDADAGEIDAPPSRIPAGWAEAEHRFEVTPQGTDRADFELSSQPRGD